MRDLILISISIFCLFSCRPNSAEDNFSNLNNIIWTKADSLSSYSLQNKSDKLVLSTDSITISFLGKLNKDNIVTTSKNDSQVFVNISGFEFGTFSKSNISKSETLQILIAKMKKNSVLLLKWQNSNIQNIEPDDLAKLSIYLRDSVDSIEALKFISQILKSNYIKSYKYISKSEAAEIFVKNNPDLSNFRDFTHSNPLPASIETYVYSKYINLKSLDSLKNILLKDLRIDEVMYGNSKTIEYFNDLKELMHSPFIIKISS